MPTDVIDLRRATPGATTWAPLCQRIAHCSPGLTILAIDGNSGAGKTHLARSLSAALTDFFTADAALALIEVIEIDDHVPGWDHLALGVERVASGLRALRAGAKSAAIPTWDWFANAPGPARIVRRPDHGRHIIVCEGCGAGALDAVGPQWMTGGTPAPERASARAPERATEYPHLIDLLIWIQAPTELRWQRVAQRDDFWTPALWRAWASQEDALRAAWGAEQHIDWRILTG